ncbi:TRAP transporter permease [Psychromarinibacter halotolerans]|uniref:TRAP transporter permease n=1 Tax=Psychromarinibacter halotolerans TaxID=1775175 RepID=A0ABV7GVG6_9RHOB|nr:TRAP transporter fused permease subunit [Psychromarinibacter halotolerans]MDF0595239.1 TRAP transporter fused permease subunit [Psychromarinibacter halotolerans]
MTDTPTSPALRTAAHILGGVMMLCAVAFALDVPRQLGVALYTEQYLAAVLGLGLAMAFLIAPRFRGALAVLDPLLAAVALVAAGYVAWTYPVLVNELVYKPLDGLVVALVLAGLAVEAVRRMTGPGLTIIVGVFILYGLFGHLLPFGMSRQIQWDRLAIYVAMDTNGMMGLPLMVTSVVVMTFVLMGQVLTRSGGGEFFNDLALSLVGRTRGGAAKIAVVSSFLFGSVSGSAVANVAASGVVTLPLMRRAGYKPHLAASIEALASTGGQLAPPIMGAAAFLMAEFLQIPYGTVVLAAIIPSALFYLAIFFYVDNHAAATGLRLPEDVEIRPLLHVLKDGWQFVAPFVVLIGGLFVLNWRPEMAALAAAALLAVLALILPYRGKRATIPELAFSLPRAGVAMIEIVVISAAAGIVIGVLNLSGLSFSLTLSLVSMAEGSLFLLLLLAGGVSVVLGMGMPTVGVYVLLASLIGPALTQAGINPIAAHMFLLYFGMLSMITPPVALASFTAASMAGADWMKTGFTAVRIGWVAYLIPFVMVFEPGLVMQADTITVVWQAAGALAGVYFATGAIFGYLRRPLSMPMRIFLMACALVAILPIEIAGLGHVVNVVAILAGAATLLLPFQMRNSQTEP